MSQIITPQELSRRLAAGERIQLLDVRQPEEHALARIADSILIPLGELAGRVDEVPMSAMTVVYCHHGIRSLSGAAILERAGHAAAFSLAGGIDAWSVEIDPNIPRY